MPLIILLSLQYSQQALKINSKNLAEYVPVFLKTAD
jgi:hypothetical protein